MAASLGMGQRKLLAERLLALRPVAPRLQGRVRRREAKGPGRLALLLDPLLGIDRRIASDEQMSALPALLGGGAAAAATFVCLTTLLGVPLWLALSFAAAAAVAAARTTVTGRRDKTRQLMEEQFALALGVIIRCVRAGLPVNEGMRAVAAEVAAPSGPEFRRVVDQIQLGTGFDAALVMLADRCALADYRFFAVSVAL